MKKFDIPAYYRSSLTGRVKEHRRRQDSRKQDFSPAILDFGSVRFILARHFGFCYGVENAIEISYRALEENQGREVFLLSQMIHNPEVNDDLRSRGIRFIMDTDGSSFIPWDSVPDGSIVIIPAFGTTLETEELLRSKHIDVRKYNTTCPFVEKVWNRAAKLGKDNYTVIIHGKPRHEETRATFSHSASGAPSVIIRDMSEAQALANYILGSKPDHEFYAEFQGRYSQGFVPSRDLVRTGVVNQTTMLASETQAIADFIKQIMQRRYGDTAIGEHFADTRDTLCYATNDNQDSTHALLEAGADLALVVGGYNSSNTSHIVELCESRFPTYFISSDKEIISASEIQHFIYKQKELRTTYGYLPEKRPVRFILTSGASCPDTLVDKVLLRILSFFPDARPVDDVMSAYQ